MIKAAANISLLAHPRPSRKGGGAFGCTSSPQGGIRGGPSPLAVRLPPKEGLEGALILHYFSQHLLNHLGEMLLFQHMHLGGNVVRGVGGLERRLELGDDFATVTNF